ncbi:unnamed protein product [Diabrotica balteata]|uniref:Pre-mRNA-splicing factor 18 n=1 Tax=Diabrotica balteata TaxID=107213 RepID=A0A9N9SVA1_DIABA|nr:unnamed protein product [Diabrotica balteata]
MHVREFNPKRAEWAGEKFPLHVRSPTENSTPSSIGVRCFAPDRFTCPGRGHRSTHVVGASVPVNNNNPIKVFNSSTVSSFQEASAAFLQMAIGNAPWPIGVTMVGIHARTGREKIFSKNVAHVMNDETQRKYIQGLKRLMTKCQEFYPTDPSRCVEYQAFGKPEASTSE